MTRTTKVVLLVAALAAAASWLYHGVGHAVVALPRSGAQGAEVATSARDNIDAGVVGSDAANRAGVRHEVSKDGSLNVLRIRGRVLDGMKRVGVTSGSVTLRISAPCSAELVSVIDPGGYFEFEVPCDDQSVPVAIQVESDGYADCSLGPAPMSGDDMVIQLWPATSILVSVKDGGKPAAGAVVSVRDAMLGGVEFVGEKVWRAVADGDGKVVFNKLPRGGFHVVARARDGRTASLHSLQLTGGVNEVVCEIDALRDPVSFRVVASDTRQPLVAVEVCDYRTWRPISTTDKFGRFRVDRVGLERLRFRAPGFVDTERSLGELGAGDVALDRARVVRLDVARLPGPITVRLVQLDGPLGDRVVPVATSVDGVVSVPVPWITGRIALVCRGGHQVGWVTLDCQRSGSVGLLIPEVKTRVPFRLRSRDGLNGLRVAARWAQVESVVCSGEVFELALARGCGPLQETAVNFWGLPGVTRIDGYLDGKRVGGVETFIGAGGPAEVSVALGEVVEVRCLTDFGRPVRCDVVQRKGGRPIITRTNADGRCSIFVGQNGEGAEIRFRGVESTPARVDIGGVQAFVIPRDGPHRVVFPTMSAVIYGKIDASALGAWSAAVSAIDKETQRVYGGHVLDGGRFEVAVPQRGSYILKVRRHRVDGASFLEEVVCEEEVRVPNIADWSLDLGVVGAK